MTELTPEIEPAARQFAEDMAQANRMPFAALVMRHARAMSLIRHLMRSRRWWQGEAFEHLFTYSLENTERVDTQQQLDAAHARIEVLLAEAQADQRAIEEARDERDEAIARRDEHVDYDGRLSYLGGMSRRLLDEKNEATRWAAWFAAEAAYWKTEADLYHTVAAQNYESDGITVAALDAERTELQARVAELEATQGEPDGYAVTVDSEGGRWTLTDPAPTRRLLHPSHRWGRSAVLDMLRESSALICTRCFVEGFEDQSGAFEPCPMEVNCND